MQFINYKLTFNYKNNIVCHGEKRKKSLIILPPHQICCWCFPDHRFITHIHTGLERYHLIFYSLCPLQLGIIIFMQLCTQSFFSLIFCSEHFPINEFWKQVGLGVFCCFFLKCQGLKGHFLTMDIYVFYNFSTILFIYFQRGREGEKHPCVVASHVPPNWGLGPQPRHVP